MLKEEKDGITEGTHIHFRYLGISPGRLTATWYVNAGEPTNAVPLNLGHVSWYGAWRKYCFFPNGATVYEEKCLAEIAQFISRETSKYRTQKKRTVSA